MFHVKREKYVKFLPRGRVGRKKTLFFASRLELIGQRAALILRLELQSWVRAEI